MARYGEAQKKATEKFFKEKYRHISVAMPAPEAEALKKAAKDTGSSVSGYIREAVKMRIEKENEERNDANVHDS